MRHVTILPSESHVYIDGISRIVDLSTVDSSIHAIQWSVTNNSGEVEFVNDAYAPAAEYRPNQAIASFAPYQRYVDAWNAVAAKPVG
jgi:hypothetical protein